MIDSERLALQARKCLPSLFAMVSFFFGVALASPTFDDDYDAKPWAEIEVTLPSAPQEKNLLSFAVGAVRDTRFMIDKTSLSIGVDGVVRYTLVIVGSGGARNVSYEGLRCETRERRYYAFGHADGTWGKARSNKWLPIRGGTNNPHVELHGAYLCDLGVPLFTTDEILRRIRERTQVDYDK